MKRTRVLLVFGLLVGFGLAMDGSAQSSSPWLWGPLVGAVTDSVAVISWESTRPVSVDMHYGLAEAYEATGTWDETLTFDRQEGHAEIWLRDLTPDREYACRLVAYEGDAVYPTKIGAFRTLGPDLRSLSFLAYGHTRSFPDRHKLVADTMASIDAAASHVVHVGELVDTFSSERLANFRWAISNLGRNTSYVSAVPSSGTGDDAYFDAFALPQGGGAFGEQWWAVETGALCLIALDSSLDDPSNPAALEQAAWLRQTLSLSNAALRIVFSSDPLYSSRYVGGRNDQLISLWKDILVGGDADVLVSSFPGGYEHGYTSGIHYINTGGGGGPSVQPVADRVPGLVYQRTDILHYVRFTAVDTDLHVEAVPVASVINDEIFLTPSAGAVDSFSIRGEM